jgi:urease accessory protein
MARMVLVVIIIENIDKDATAAQGAEHDVIVMGWEDRRRARQRVSTMGGRECAFALPTGTVLAEGQVVYTSPEFYITVTAAPEDVLVVPLHHADAAAALGYEMGNRHLPVSIGEGRLSTPYDRLVEEMLARSGVPYERRNEPFEPVRVLHHHHG